MQPFKVANITEDKSSPLLQLMLMSSSPGILDGDEYNLEIKVAAESSLSLQTQSYQRLYNMKSGASQQMCVDVANGGAFYFVPHPSVPHKASSFFSKNIIRLSTGCRLLWGEVITCGRKESGEEFLFSKFQSITEIFLEKKLVVKENVVITPLLSNVHAIGQLEGYTHQAMLLFLDENVDIKFLIENITGLLSGIKNIEFGISAAAVNGFTLRLLGYKAEQLYDILKLISKNFIIDKYHTNVR